MKAFTNKLRDGDDGVNAIRGWDVDPERGRRAVRHEDQLGAEEPGEAGGQVDPEPAASRVVRSVRLERAVGDVEDETAAIGGSGTDPDRLSAGGVSDGVEGESDEETQAVGIGLDPAELAIDVELAGGGALAALGPRPSGQLLQDVAGIAGRGVEPLLAGFEAGDVDHGVDEVEELSRGAGDAPERVPAPLGHIAEDAIGEELLVADDDAERASQVVAQRRKEAAPSVLGALRLETFLFEAAVELGRAASGAYEGGREDERREEQCRRQQGCHVALAQRS